MWVDNLQALGLQTANPIYELVTTKKPLSDALQSKCQHLTVQVIAQQLTENNCFVRQVYLVGDNTRLVHAITTAPYLTYLKFKHELDNLGNNLLGKTFLYVTPFVRTAFEYAILDGVVARRSSFVLEDYQITVQESFLKLF